MLSGLSYFMQFSTIVSIWIYSESRYLQLKKEIIQKFKQFGRHGGRVKSLLAQNLFGLMKTTNMILNIKKSLRPLKFKKLKIDDCFPKFGGIGLCYINYGLMST